MGVCTAALIHGSARRRNSSAGRRRIYSAIDGTQLQRVKMAGDFGDAAGPVMRTSSSSVNSSCSEYFLGAPAQQADIVQHGLGQVAFATRS